jgi:ferredoxin
MATFTITVVDTGDVFRAREDDSVLEAMEGLGRSCITVGCRSGGCGVCKIEVVEGRWVGARPMSRAHVSEEDERAGRVLACRIRAAGDLRIRVAEERRTAARRAGESGLNGRFTRRGERSWR